MTALGDLDLDEFDWRAPEVLTGARHMLAQGVHENSDLGLDFTTARRFMDTLDDELVEDYTRLYKKKLNLSLEDLNAFWHDIDAVLINQLQAVQLDHLIA